MTAIARQGHVYMLNGMRVMALETGERATVARLDTGELWPLQERSVVQASNLKPLPMVYFAGQVPR